jgi:hypothetical protein
MSLSCNITVQFQVHRSSEFVAVAVEHIWWSSKIADFNVDALHLLEYAAGGSGIARGPQGDMFTWGYLGNHSNFDTFVDVLVPFWRDLYGKHVVLDGDGIVIMYQQAQSPCLKIAEISLDRTSSRGRTLVVREGEISFPLFGWYSERHDRALPPNVSIVPEEKS